MVETGFQLLGGVGLFLLGMSLLTDGLKSFAGEALRRALIRFTGTPFKAFVSGTAATLLVQSSSATTVALIGFVSAGLLTFPQAVGVVFGASLGTTGTGWIVSAVGLKVNMGLYALPLVALGTFLKLLGRGRWRSLGLALAGFGLLFTGIGMLQAGMLRVSEVLPLASLPGSGFAGHLSALAAGAVLTVAMQSSSAAVATTLTALHAGAVNFEQAAALVIGAAVGTTATGALAAFGGSVAAKRTALAHVSFNAATGLFALLFLPLFLRGIAWMQVRLDLEPGATSLAAFHTAFIAVGVAAFLPLVGPFARAVERALPERGPEWARYLDASLLNVPAVALEATRRAFAQVAVELFEALDGILTGDPDAAEVAASKRPSLHEGLEKIQRFFAVIPAAGEQAPLSEMRLAQMHALDHLGSLQASLRVPGSREAAFSGEPLREAAGMGHRLLSLAGAGLQGQAAPDWKRELERQAQELSEWVRRERPRLLRLTASGDRKPASTLEALDAMRWLDGVASHAARLGNYLGAPGKTPNRAISPIPAENPLAGAS